MDFMNRMRSRAEQRRRGEYLGERLGKSLCFAQADMVVANAAGAAVRADINAQLEAVATRQSGGSAPSTTYPHQLWVDTTNGVVKRRNAANSGWLMVETIDETFVLSRSSNTLLDVSDRGKTIRATGSYTQTFDAVATLGDGWWVGFRVESGATLTLDPNSTETIDGAATLAIVGPASGIVVCNGSALFTVALASLPTAAQGASLVLLATAAPSSSASVEFTSGIDAIYDQYIVEWDSVIPATNGVEFHVTLSADAGANWKSSGYKWARSATLDGGTQGAEGGTSDGAFKPHGSVTATNNTGRGFAGQLTLYAPASTTIFKHLRAHSQLFDGSNFYSLDTAGGWYGGADALNGLKFAMSSGNIASGNFRLYGVKKS